MMKKIAHRGNYLGRSKFENSPEYIDKALAKGYEAEIDLRLVGRNFYLGHDKPQYKIDNKWLIKRKERLWCHAKDKKTFIALNKLGMNTFIHDKDLLALTTKGYLWEYPKVYEKNGELHAICADIL